MDPTACFERLIDALNTGDTGEANDAAKDLAQWLTRGGFEPLQWIQDAALRPWFWTFFHSLEK